MNLRMLALALALRASLVGSILLALLIWPPANALIPVPPLEGHVTDLTKTLSAEQKAALEQSLTAYETRKGTQIAVLLVTSTRPEAIEPFAIRVAEQWKIGRKKVDDGVILIIAKADRSLRIEVGYGLEGVLTDLNSQRIINDTIVPRFKEDDIYGGIAAGVAAIVQILEGEALPKPAPKTPDGLDTLSQYLPLLLIFALLCGAILRVIFGRIPGAFITGILVTLIAWFVLGAIFISIVAGAIALALTLWG
ncbi:MAG: YgcG family protein, partial [Betaproteobacteria bacterium]|nr:YgcG family protein [Betaproteobacteria bacterium]